jgi:hypothetical protein
MRLSYLFPHLRLRWVQPEMHTHLAVHPRRCRQMLSGLLLLIGRPQELTEVEVAVGDERLHPELTGQSQGPVVVVFRSLDSRRIATAGDFTEQAETPRLVTTLLVALRQRHGLLRTFQSIVEAPFEQVCLAEPRKLHRSSHAHRTHRRCVLYHLFEEVPTLARTRGECVCVSETGKGRPGLEVPLTADGSCPLKRIDGPVEITLSKGYATDARQGLGEREWVISAFGDPECLLGMLALINELPEIRETQGYPAV